MNDVRSIGTVTTAGGAVARLLPDGTWDVPGRPAIARALKQLYSETYQGPQDGPFGFHALHQAGRLLGGVVEINSDAKRVNYAAEHAPHSMTIGGKDFRGGEFIPNVSDKAISSIRAFHQMDAPAGALAYHLHHQGVTHDDARDALAAEGSDPKKAEAVLGEMKKLAPSGASGSGVTAKSQGSSQPFLPEDIPAVASHHRKIAWTIQPKVIKSSQGRDMKWEVGGSTVELRHDPDPQGGDGPWKLIDNGRDDFTFESRSEALEYVKDRVGKAIRSETERGSKVVPAGKNVGDSLMTAHGMAADGVVPDHFTAKVNEVPLSDAEKSRLAERGGKGGKQANYAAEHAPAGGTDAAELTGGEWITMEGKHVYIKDGKIVAGGNPGMIEKKSNQPQKNPSDSVKWHSPSLSEESEEIQRTAEDLGLNSERLQKSSSEMKMISLSDKDWSRLENTDSWDIDPGNIEKVKEFAQEYGRDSDRLIEAFKTGKSLPAPLVISYDNKLYLIGGNTRLMTARAMGVRPKIALIPYGLTGNQANYAQEHSPIGGTSIGGKDFPGGQFTPGDHDKFAAKVAQGESDLAEFHGKPNPGNFRYQHGGPRGSADQRHLAKATARGKTALVIEERPHVEVIRDEDMGGRTFDSPRLGGSSTYDRSVFRKPDATHHIVENQHVASVWSEPSATGDKHYSLTGWSQERHKTRAGAEKRAANEATRVSRQERYSERLTIDPRKFDPGDHANLHKHRTTVFRVIEAGESS